MRSRPLGVRVYLLLAMMTVAITGVVITGLLTYNDVEAELSRGESQIGAKLPGCILRAVVEAGLISGALALLLAIPISLSVARPLRQLNAMANRILPTGSPGRQVAIGGGREIGELGATLERVAATLRRQHQLRRDTAADVGHELRGGLGSMLCRVEAVQDGVVDREAVWREIATDIRRMVRVVDDLQLLVEAQRPSALVANEHVDLAAVVRGRVRAYAQRFSAASLRLEEAIAPACVAGDPERLAQVVDNLLSNALRYTDRGGRVSVTVSQAGEEAVIVVADTGIGIPEAYVGHVFDRFWRAPGATARAAGGSGVGLAVVRDLVMAHHGRVEVDTRPGGGSRFSVHLPLATETAAPEPLRPAPAPATSGSRGVARSELGHQRAFV